MYQAKNVLSGFFFLHIIWASRSRILFGLQICDLWKCRILFNSQPDLLGLLERITTYDQAHQYWYRNFTSMIKHHVRNCLYEKENFLRMWLFCHKTDFSTSVKLCFTVLKCHGTLCNMLLNEKKIIIKLWVQTCICIALYNKWYYEARWSR